MKNILSFITLAFAVLLWTSCEKVKNDPNALDYYKNKNIVLTLSSETLKSSDYYEVKISAVALGDRPNGNPKIVVNGEVATGDYAIITKDHILDGPVTITATDKAWQYVAEFSASASTGGYTVLWNSTFDEVPQKEISHTVISPSIKKGIIEIKEYE